MGGWIVAVAVHFSPVVCSSAAKTSTETVHSTNQTVMAMYLCVTHTNRFHPTRMLHAALGLQCAHRPCVWAAEDTIKFSPQWNRVAGVFHTCRAPAD